MSLVSWLIDIGAPLNVSFPMPVWEVEGHGPKKVSPSELATWYHGTEHPSAPMTPLIASLRMGDFKRIKYLLGKGADPNCPGKDGLTPLMYAVRKNQMTVVKLLLNHDYDPKEDGVKAQKSGAEVLKTLGMFGVRKWQAKRTQLPNGDDDDSDRDDEDDMDEEDEDNFDEEEEEEPEEEPEDEPEDEEEEEEEPDEEDEEAMDENGEDEEMDVDDEDSQENGDDAADQKKKKATGKGAKKNAKPEFVKTSAVDLSARDSKGRTVLHHVVQTCDYGTYENVELLQLLHHLGAGLEVRDKEGRTPLDYALQAGSNRMAKEIQQLQGVKAPQMKRAVIKKSTWTDGCDWSGAPSIDIKEDSAALLAKIKAENEKDLEEVPKYPRPKVDTAAELKEAGEVLMDEDQDIPYDLLMTKVDIKYGHHGMNNFYKMQVVHAKGKDLYVLLTRWGRVGDRGQYQRTPFATKDEAVVEFCKIFKAKSGNSWSAVQQFTKYPGKYNLVRTDPYFDKKTIKQVEFDFQTDMPSKLPQATYDLLKTLTSPNMLRHAMKQCGASEKFLPFGHIQQDALDQALKILDEIQGLLKEMDDDSNMKTNEKHTMLTKIWDKSSEFYMTVPNDTFSYRAITPIERLEGVESLKQHLSDMYDLAITANLMMGAQQRVKDMHPMDYIYRSLDCEIEALAEDDVMAQLILKQLHNTGQQVDVKVQRIYRLRRKGEEDRLQGCSLDNHRLLWHGTKPANMLSIFKRGLIITPIGSAWTGFRFGHGIYHADAFIKSYGYAFPYQYNEKCDSKFLFVNEVALGKIQEDDDYDETLKKGFHSRKSVGGNQPDPAQDLLLPTGGVLPIGEVKQVRKNAWEMNEFVVYKESQVCLRYLVQIKD